MQKLIEDPKKSVVIVGKFFFSSQLYHSFNSSSQPLYTPSLPLHPLTTSPSSPLYLIQTNSNPSLHNPQTPANQANSSKPATSRGRSTSPSRPRPILSSSARTSSRTASGSRAPPRTARWCSTAGPACAAEEPPGSRRRPVGRMWVSILGAGWTGRRRGGRFNTKVRRWEGDMT